MAESALVTVLFTDLVGSTEQTERIGDAAADALRRQHFESLRAVIDATGGAEVKTIGDAVMVTYRGAADAIDGAVAMQQAVERDNQAAGPTGEHLSMRLGISAGDATFEDDDWFGRPVVEAARLCAEAGGGQILISETVGVLAGSRTGHEVRRLGEKDLKGLPDPLQTSEVVWESLPPDHPDDGLDVPLPPQLERVDAFSFVGREDEAEMLVAAWKEVLAGNRRTVLVTGEPGIGKTRLTSEVARTAHDQGAIVLWGGCEEDLGVPYQPVAEALGHLARTAEPGALAPLLGPLGGELTRLLPDLARLVPGLAAPEIGDAETERYRMFEAVVDVLAALSTDRPVVLVLDDLHWAGKPTLLLLLHILRSTQPLQLLVVVTYRDTDLDRRHPLAEALADLRRMPDVERVALTGLDAEGVSAFMVAAAGHELAPEGIQLAAALHDETEGNPFFVGEVLLHLVESGALIQEEGRWVGSRSLQQVGLPEGVREVVGRRLSRLPEEANDVLTMAAAIGRDFDLSLLAAVHDGGQAAVLEALEPAEASGLVRPVEGKAGRYTFDHALVRSTLYEELSTSRRLRLHRDVGRALEERGDPDERLAELARHFAECAALGEVDRAVDYGRRAADRALEDLAFEEAAAHLERALGALEVAERAEPAVQCDLLLARGAALKEARDPAFRSTFFSAADLARTTDDTERLAIAAVGLSSGLPLRGDLRLDGEIALLDEVLDLLPEGDGALRAQAMAAQTINLMAPRTADPGRRRELSDESLAMARRLGDVDVLLEVLRDRWAGVYDTIRPGFLQAFRELQEEAIEKATGRHEVMLCGALGGRAMARLMVGDGDGAEPDLAANQALASRLRRPGLVHQSMLYRAARTILTGPFDLAESEAFAALAHAQAHELDGVAPFGSQLYRIRFDQGRLAELEDLVAQQVADFPEVITWRNALAGVYAETDRPELVAQQLDVVAADDFGNVPQDMLWIVAVGSAAGIAGAIGHVDVAGPAYELALPHAGTLLWTGSAMERPIDLHLSRAALALGRADDAERHAQTALDLCRRVGAPYYVAYCHAQLARVLATRAEGDDLDRARTLATQLLADSQALGMARVVETTTRLLAELDSGA